MKKTVYIAPTYTLTWEDDSGPRTRTGLSPQFVSKIGGVVGRLADRGNAWNIAVLNPRGNDVTFSFPVFGG